MSATDPIVLLLIAVAVLVAVLFVLIGTGVVDGRMTMPDEAWWHRSSRRRGRQVEESHAAQPVTGRGPVSDATRRAEATMGSEPAQHGRRRAGGPAREPSGGEARVHGERQRPKT